ncbi:hypothetical protein ACFE04_009313 [Oxalis oulophora]
MKQYLDCDQIQPYKCNKLMVVSLNPLPHNGVTIYADEISCKTCKRKLMDPDVVDYCSILCKTIAFDKKRNKNVPPFLSLANVIEDEEENGEIVEEEQEMDNIGDHEAVNAELAQSQPNIVVVEDNKSEQEVDQHRREKPQWLDAFLAQTCHYCMLSGIHGDHDIVQIYRHIYQNVVCRHSYKCNINMMVSLNPLPHDGLATYADEICCKTCRRILMDPNELIIATIALDKKEKENVLPFLSPIANEIKKDENGGTEEKEKVMTNGEQQLFIVNHEEAVNVGLALIERELESVVVMT